MLKSLFHWKVLVNILLAGLVFTGLVWLTFRWLEFHTNHGKEIAVPNVINKSVHDAIKILDDSGLTYEGYSFKYDPLYRPFQVLQIYPSAGSVSYTHLDVYKRQRWVFLCRPRARRGMREESDAGVMPSGRRASEATKQKIASAKDFRIPHPLIPR